MKKIIGILALTLISLQTSNAQTIAKHALGLRVGDNNGFGSEVTYQRSIAATKRLEFGLGWRDYNSVNAFKLAALHQWVYPIKNRFNWYVGAGAGAGFVDTDNNTDVFALISGDIGIEYNFEIPLLISLDLRPEIGFNDTYSDGIDSDLGLSLRYQF